jgi:hypothetical protein
MGRVRLCVAAVLLAASANAGAGGGLYPPLAFDEGISIKTRAQVIAELHEAIRLGAMQEGERDFPAVTSAQSRAIARAVERAGGEEAAQQAVAAYPDDVIVVWGDPRVIRTRIQAEAAEANRLGLLSFGEGDPPVATSEQEQMIAAAGRRAVDRLRVAALWPLP